MVPENRKAWNFFYYDHSVTSEGYKNVGGNSTKQQQTHGQKAKYINTQLYKHTLTLGNFLTSL